MSRAQLFGTVAALMREPQTGSRLTEQCWEDLIHVLRDTDLLGTLCYLAEAQGSLDAYPEYARRHLTSMKIYSKRQACQVLYESSLIHERLMAVGVKPIFLKGAGYTLRGSRNSFGRIYSDIDVLVDRSEIDRAQVALHGDGWYSPPITDYDERYYRQWAHEVPPMKHLVRRTVLDLHHNVVPPVSGRAPDMGIMLKGVTQTSRGMFVLSAPAATLHSLVHLLNNEDLSRGFRDLVDLRLLLEEYGDEAFWSDLIALAEETSFMQELVRGIWLLEQIFGYQVPEGVQTTLHQPLRKEAGGFVARHVLLSAVRPHHSLVCGAKENLAIQMAYLRGHWIKMPLPILVKHLAVKAGMAIGNKLLGKYRSAPTLE